MEPIRHIRVKHQKLFLINEKLHMIAQNMISANPQINNPKDGVANFILAKSFKTHRVILSLAESGFSEDADMLTRTLFDGFLIIGASLKDDTDNTVIKYFRFDDILRIRMFHSMQDTDTFQSYISKRKNNPKPDDESIETIEKRAMKWKKEYGGEFWNRWHSGLKTSKIAESLDIKKYCETAYSLQSQLIHSLPRAINNYIVTVGDSSVMDTSPKERGVDVTLVSAFDMFFNIVNVYDKHYHLGHEKELTKLVDDLTGAVK